MERVGDRVGGVRVCCDVLRERERFEAQRWRAGLRLAALFLLQPAPVAGEIFRDDLHRVVGVDVVIAIRVIERQHFLVRARIVQREVAVDHLQRAPHLGDDVRHGPASPVAAVFAAVRPVVDVHVALDGHVRPRRGRDIHALALEAQARHEIAQKKSEEAIERREAQIENLQGQIDHLRDKMETTTSQEYLDNMEGWIQEKEERIQDLKAQIEDIRQKLR